MQQFEFVVGWRGWFDVHVVFVVWVGFELTMGGVVFLVEDDLHFADWGTGYSK
jgi:hypothetical protein